MRRSYFKRSNGRTGERPGWLRDVSRAAELAGTWALPAVLLYWWKRYRTFFSRLAGAVDALREDADEIRAALTTTGAPAVPAPEGAAPEQVAVSEELGRTTSALHDLAAEVRTTGEQSRDGTAMLSELVAAVSEYGVHLRSHTAVMRNLAATTEQLQEAATRLSDVVTSPPARVPPHTVEPTMVQSAEPPTAAGEHRSRQEPAAREVRRDEIRDERWREPFTASELRWPDLPRTADGYVAEPVDRLLDRAADALDLAERERDSLRERVLVVETRLAILTEQQQLSLRTRLAAQRDEQERDARARHDATVALQEASRRVADIVRDIEEERQKLLGLARELGAQLRVKGEGPGNDPASALTSVRPPAAGGASPPGPQLGAPEAAPPAPWTPSLTPTRQGPVTSPPPAAASDQGDAAPSHQDDTPRRERPDVPPVWEVAPIHPRR